MPMWLITKLLGFLTQKTETKGKQSELNKFLMKKALMAALPISVRKQIGNVESIKEIVFPSERSQVEKIQKSLFPSAKQKQQANLQKQLGELTGGLLGAKKSQVTTKNSGATSTNQTNPADLTQLIAKTVLALTKK